MRRNLIALLAVVLAASGLAASMLAFPARADNPQGVHQIEDLWPLGYTIGLRGIGPVNNPLGCSNLIVLTHDGIQFPDGEEPVIEINPDPNHPDCRTPQPQIQANIDALLATYPPPAPAPTTTDAPAAPADPVTTTTTAPVDPPATTVTDPSPVAPATADPAPAEQPVTATAEPAPAVTVADSGSAVDQAADAALSDALASGADAPTAALIARSAGLNAEYGL
jgi:hypothetical protein